MNLLHAASAPTVLEAALEYQEAGLSILPVSGKEPAIKWTTYQRQRPTADDVRRWYAAGKLHGVGVICGRVSGLVVIDLDGDQAVRAFEMKFSGMMETYAVRSGSGHGLHLYYAPRFMPSTTRTVGTAFGNFELRADGCYVVAPPSIHPSGAPYSIYNRARVLAVNDLNPIRDWFLCLMREKHGGKMPPPASRPQQTGQIRNATRYGQAALAGECAKVRAARDGRNNTLYSAALRLGNLVAGGHLSRADVERALFDAAAHLSATDGEGGTIRTIASGLNRGIENGMTGR